jgi:hypothetical protein
MWLCPKCQSRVDDSFEVCWSCGTTPDGTEDPDFITADDADPIHDEKVSEDSDFDDPLADFAGTPLPDLVACYTASDAAEAKFIADELMERGIPAIPDKLNIDSLVGMYGSGAKVRVRKDDLFRAHSWLKGYEHRRHSKQCDLD